MRKIISVNEISQKSPTEIKEDLSNARYSLLKSLGCGKMIRGFFWVRWACLFFMNMAARRARKKKITLKQAFVEIFYRGAPSDIYPKHASAEPRMPFPQIDTGLVIGFNHPSLGEIIRLMGLCMDSYPGKKYLFPVNIVWYEALVPVIDRLAEIDFYITPIITPSAKEKMLKCAKTDVQRAEIERLSAGFSTVYINECAAFIDNQDIALVAPSARRKYLVFDNILQRKGEEPIEPQTMTLLAISLLRKKLNFAVLPVAVIPPITAGRGLNLLRTYKIIVCPPVSSQMAQFECNEREEKIRSRRFERYFLEKIAYVLEQNDAADMAMG